MRVSPAFFPLLQAGLWGRGVRLRPYHPIDFDEIFQSADEQSVVGLIAEGLEHVEDMKVTKPQALPFLKKVFGFEDRNHRMNEAINSMISRFEEEGINAVLLKGQGVAQCYCRPEWRSSGDIDFFFSEEDYPRAKALMLPMAASVQSEFTYQRHLGLTIDDWTVELHGTFRSRLSKRIDSTLDELQKSMFDQKEFRFWNNGGVAVTLPSPDYDIIFVFTHILHHFFFEGIGLRQICDWCRLLWTFRDSIDRSLLEQRLRTMRIQSEWYAFAAYAVEFLGMPTEAMPLYEESSRWHRAASRINDFVIASGNFGNKRERETYLDKPYLVRKTRTFFERIRDLSRHIAVFPLDSVRFSSTIISSGLHAVFRGQ